MSAYADAAAAVSGNEPDRPGQCAASGCCLPGVMSTSTQGPKEWWCRLHFGAPRAEHDDITARAANRKQLLAAALRLTTLGTGEAIPAKAREHITALGRAELLTPPDTARRWTAHALGSHMLEVLGRECRTPQQTMAPPSAARNWVDASQPEEIDA